MAVWRGETFAREGALDADVLALSEVSTRGAVRRLASPRVAMVIEGNDASRNVGVVSRHPIDHVRSHADARDGDAPMFTRDCLEACVVHPVLGDVWLLVYDGAATPAARQRTEGDHVTKLAVERALVEDHVIVVGLPGVAPAPGFVEVAPGLRVSHALGKRVLPRWGGQMTAFRCDLSRPSPAPF